MSKKNTITNMHDEILFETVFNNSAVGLALVAPDGKWLKVNKAVLSIVGYTEDELLQMTFQDITHEDDLDKDLEYLQQMLDNTIQTYQMEKRYYHKDGHIVWIMLTVSLIRNEQDEPQFFISEIQDISALKKTQQDLEEKVAELEKMNKAMVSRELAMAAMKKQLDTSSTSQPQEKTKQSIKELDLS
jgi:PAS domain S-box-containing protein